MLQMVDTSRNLLRAMLQKYSVGQDPTAAILRATNFGVDTRCNSAIARNIAPRIRTLRSLTATLRAGTCMRSNLATKKYC